MNITLNQPEIRVKPPLSSSKSGLYQNEFCIPVAVRGGKVQTLTPGDEAYTSYQITKALRQGADVIVLSGELTSEELNIKKADLHVQPGKLGVTESLAHTPEMLSRLRELGQSILEQRFSPVESDPEFKVYRDRQHVVISALGTEEHHTPEAALTLAARLQEGKNRWIYGEKGTLSLRGNNKEGEILNEETGQVLQLEMRRLRQLCQQLQVSSLFPNIEIQPEYIEEESDWV